MTTKVRIEPAGHFVLITITDKYGDRADVSRQLLPPKFQYVDGKTIETGSAPFEIYVTTSRTVSAVDLEPGDPRVAELSKSDRRPTE